MKRKWTKLLAVMLAGVMALSCTVFASAGGVTEPYANVNPLNGEGSVEPSDTGDSVVTEIPTDGDITDTSQKVEMKYAGGSAKGQSRSEGPLPVDPIRLELPTVAARTLDMILDPHGLINRTGMARYGGENVTFSPNTTLYFLKSVGETEDGDPTYEYGDETQALTITNKSNLPVGVDVTLRVDKGLVTSATDDFDITFVTSKEDLTSAEDAQMYLALKKGDSTYAVASYEEDSTIINPPTVDVPTATASGAELFDAIAATAPTGLTDAYNTYPKATFQWAKAVAADAEEEEEEEEATPSSMLPDVADATKNAFITGLADAGKTIVVTYAAAVAAAAATESTPAVEAVPAKFTIAAADVGAYKAEVIVDGVVTNTVTNTTRDVNVTVRYYEEGDPDEEPPTEDVDVGYVYFVIKSGALTGRTAGNAVTLTVKKDTTAIDADDMGYAGFTSSLEKPEGAYVEAWDAAGGYYWAFVEDCTPTQLESWGHKDAEAPTKYPSLSFSIIGSINGALNQASPWDGHGDKVKLDLIWDVFAVEGEIEETPTVNGNKAKITSVTPATGVTTSKGKATINFTPGDGDYEGYVPTALVAGDTLVPVDAASTATSAVVQTKDVRDATTFALRFELDDDSYDVPITEALW